MEGVLRCLLPYIFWDFLEGMTWWCDHAKFWLIVYLPKLLTGSWMRPQGFVYLICRQSQPPPLSVLPSLPALGETAPDVPLQKNRAGQGLKNGVVGGALEGTFASLKLGLKESGPLGRLLQVWLHLGQLPGSGGPWLEDHLATSPGNWILPILIW